MGAGELHLQDWFVPILYQERHDPQLFDRIPNDIAAKMQVQQRQTLLGALPETPPHNFIGRSRELLVLERLLEHHPYAVIRGQGGAGKTVLAVELARWLVRSRRYERCAFVSLEEYSEMRGVLDALGRQLVADYSVAEYGDDLEKAMQQGDTAEVGQHIGQLINEPTWQEYKPFLYKLLAILAGERDAALAEDKGLDYEAAAELTFLLEQLNAQKL